MDERRKLADSGDKEEDIEEYFPAIFREFQEGEEKLLEEETRTASRSKKARKFSGHTPGVIDFICRCKTEEEALEIIDYMLRKGDISENHSNDLKNQLKEKGYSVEQLN